MTVDGIEQRTARAEAGLRQALLAQDVEAARQWLSPSLFFTDAAGHWQGAHPCLEAWAARRLRVVAIEQSAIEYLACGQLLLAASDVSLTCIADGGEQLRRLRLLRVWARCSSPAGVHLLSVGMLPARDT
ncbi:nuclear transport factor 2 family protein [Stenotrophomonas sp. NPDC077421]|uniref:nuclear transport factor 2 family protein n=1 Tax=Stenotrophomonas sp. NPDC077421 TaxID=3414699 RepID=UPI003C2D2AD8